MSNRRRRRRASRRATGRASSSRFYREKTTAGEERARSRRRGRNRRRRYGTDTGGGAVHGDTVGVVAAYVAWNSAGGSRGGDGERRRFAREHGLDHNALLEMKSVRSQLRSSLLSAGLCTPSPSHDTPSPTMVSCTLVAGLYPNISTPLRPSCSNGICQRKLVVTGGLDVRT